VTLSGMAQLSGEVVDSGGGMYTATYTASRAGDYTLSITLQGRPISGSPFHVLVCPSAGSAPCSRVADELAHAYAVAGEPVQLRVQAMDQFGNALNLGGNLLEARLHCASSVIAGKVQDMQNGSYEIECMATVAGLYKLAVQMDKAHISGSPFDLTVGAADVSPEACTVSKPKLSKTSQGGLVHIEVQLKDAFGNDRPSGADSLMVHIKGPSSPAGHVEPKPSGLYSLQFPSLLSGTYMANIFVNGVSIGKAVSVDVAPGAAFAPLCEVDDSCEFQRQVAGEKGKLIVIARDKQGNRMKCGGDLISLSLDAHADSFQSKVQDLKDGTYEVTFSAQRAGDFLLSIKVDKLPIRGSPFPLTIVPSKGKISLNGKPLKAATIAGDRVSLVLEHTDAYGNHIALSARDVSVSMTHLTREVDSPTVAVALQSVPAGLVASYQATRSGEYSLEVLYSSELIAGSPFKLRVVPGPCCPSQCEINTQGIADCTPVMEQRDISFVCRDQFGNDSTDDATFVAKFFGPAAVKFAVVPAGKGRYTLQYTGEVVGLYQLYLLHNGTLLKTCPLSIALGPGPAFAASSTISAPAKSVVVAGEIFSFVLYCRDRASNSCTSCSEGVRAILRGSDQSINAIVTNNHDGTFHIAFEMLLSGQFELAVFLNEAPVGSPTNRHIVIVQGANFSAAHCVLTEAPDLSSIVAGTAFHAKIHARDRFGSALDVSGILFQATLGSFSDTPVAIHDNRNGTYSVSCRLIHAGCTSLSILQGVQHIQGSPFQLHVLAADAVPNRSSVSLPKNVEPVCGSPLAVQVIARDAFGNDLPIVPTERITARMHGPRAVEAAHATLGPDGRDGACAVAFTPRSSGYHEVIVELDGMPIFGSPLSILVQPGAIHAASCDFRMDHSPLLVGKMFIVTIVGKDANANILQQGGAAVTFQPESESGAVADVYDNFDGTYSLRITAAKRGPLRFDVCVDGTPIPGCNPLVLDIRPGAANASQSSIERPSRAELCCGEAMCCKVVLMDAFANQLDRSCDDIQAVVRGPQAVVPLVTDQHDGSFDVSFACHTAGSYQLDVSFQGLALGNSPITLSVGASETNAQASVVEVVGAPVCTAGEWCSVRVLSHDRFGNRRLGGGDKYTVRGAVEMEIKSEDHQDGSYTLACRIFDAGRHCLFVMLGADVTGSGPVLVDVLAGEVHVPSCYISGDGLAGTVAGVDRSVAIVLCDAYGNRTRGNVQAFTCKFWAVDHEETAAASFAEHGDSSYCFRYNSSRSGVHILSINYARTELPGLPMQVLVSSASTCAALCQATGSGLQTAHAGSTAAFEIYACDRFGSRRENGGDAFDVQLNGVAKVAAKLTDRGDGVYDAVYTAFRSGTYALSVLLHGRHAAGSPYQLVVAPAATHGACSSIVGGAMQSVLRAGSSISFAVQAMDQFGNKRTQGGDKLLVQFSKGGTSIKSTVKDLGDGRYEVALVGTVSIVCAMQLLLENTPIMGSPFQLAVEAGETDAAQCTIRNESVLQSAVAGEVISVVLEARDRFGNRRTEGGDSVHLRVTSASNCGERVVDHADGTYALQFTCTLTGQHTIEIRLNGSPCRNTAGGVFVVPNRASAAHTSLESHTSVATAGQRSLVVIRCRDAYSNALSKGGNTIRAQVRFRWLLHALVVALSTLYAWHATGGRHREVRLRGVR
jgi:hypothetical protein